MSDNENEKNEPLSSEDLIAHARDSMKSSIPAASHEDVDASTTPESGTETSRQHSETSQDSVKSDPVEDDGPQQLSDPRQPPAAEQPPTSWVPPNVETAPAESLPDAGRRTDAVTQPTDRIETTQPRRSRLRFLKPLLITAGIGIFFVVPRLLGATAIEDVQVGDCFDAPDNGENISEIDTFSCDEPHEYEVMQIFGYAADDAAPYPGSDAVWEDAVLGCVENFANFTGLDWETEVNILIDAIYPLRVSWEENNDREAICVLVRIDENGDVVQQTGTIRADN